MLIWIAVLTPANFARLIGLPLGSLLLLALGPGRLALAVASHRRRPAAPGGRVNHVPITCLWPGCSELGAFDRVAWSCPCRPAEFLSSLFGWVVPWVVTDD